MSALFIYTLIELSILNTIEILICEIIHKIVNKKNKIIMILIL